MTTMAAVPAHADALARLPVGHVGADRLDGADDFMPRDTGILNRVCAHHGEHVAVADAAGVNFEQDVAWTGFGNIALDQLDGTVGLGDLGNLHFAPCG